MKAFLDFIPLIAFFIGAKKFGILAGAAALLVATLLVYSIHLIKQKGKLDKQQWVTLVLTVFFCGLTLLLKDDIFLKWKSTVINGIFAVALIISVFINKPLLKLAMKTVFTLTPSGWNKLTLAWAAYFILMAGLQYYFAFYTSEQTWIDFKSYGWIPVMLVFMIGQFVFLKNHINPEITDKSKQ
ncbi:septation protein IspZ [Psychrobacter arenosus]|jgi:intracellular septation protein|uniref:septation protein IspZ n=1 Tax=Psychrobacter arenosus TaxID=256326 RepID=UPI0019196FA8|nr:septation protein IspZ [Psychrobacter arenosus]